MTGKDLLDSMEYVDAEWVEGAEFASSSKRGRRNGLLSIVIGVIVCTVLVIGVLQLVPGRNRVLSLTLDQILEVLTDENVTEPLGDLYQEVYVPAGTPVAVNPIPEVGLAPIFDRNDAPMAKKEEELQAWENGILERWSVCQGMSLEALSMQYDHAASFSVLGQSKVFVMEASRSTGNGTEDCQFLLAGEPVTVDQSLDDEEILTSLESVKRKLFAIFGVEFPDAKVVGYSQDQVAVYFYDTSAHHLNRMWAEPVTDHIQILVNREDYRGITNSADTRLTIKIRYREYRLSPDKHYENIGNARLLSLEEAEEMLSQGYVFGHKLSDYDYVSFEYMADSDRAAPNFVIPFYVFYQKTGETPEGMDIYVSAYVFASHATGLLEAFTFPKT